MASGSPRRAQILREAGIDFEVKLADVEEIFGDDPIATVKYNAVLKAREVAKLYDDRAVIVAADTLVSCEGRVLGKPKDLEEAQETLLFLSGKEQEVFTAVCLINGETEIEFSDKSIIVFKNLSLKDVTEYHNLVNPLDKAGSYNIDEHGDLIVSELKGSYENVMGLPIEELLKHFT